MTETEWVEIFRRNLIDAMRERGYSQAELAEATGLDQTSISRYICGRRIPTVRAIVNLAYELDLDISDLIDFGDRIEG